MSDFGFVEKKASKGFSKNLDHTDLDLPSMEAASNVMLRPQVRLPDLPNRFTLVFIIFIIGSVRYQFCFTPTENRQCFATKREGFNQAG
jgi:hypothetical protein